VLLIKWAFIIKLAFIAELALIIVELIRQILVEGLVPLVASI
jgi:hypothetical protein